MNKFFKRLALLLAVLMIVSMMPVQLFADNSITGEEQSNGAGEASGNSNAVAKVGDTGYESLEAALAAANGNGTVTLLTATTELVQALLDGQYGSINDLTIELPTGDYGKLELGRATKYAGSNTEYFVGGFDSTDKNYKAFTSADEIREYKGQSAWTPNCFYRRALNNVTIKAADGATVTIEKISADAGQIYGKADAPKYDYVLDVEIPDTNKSYWMALAWNNVTFEGINFKSSVNIESSSEKTLIDGLHFEKCNFNSGYTALAAANDANALSKGMGIRFVSWTTTTNNLRNLTVNNCTFEDCYEGVYTNPVYGVSVTNSNFNNINHNAVAIQDDDSAVDHGNVVISDNHFENVGNRIIRFNNVGDGTTITITGNTSVNSGKKDNGEIIKATTMPDSVNVIMASNTWGDVNGKTAVLGDGFNKVVVATVNGKGYATLADAIANATPDANGVITYEISGKATVDSTGWVQVARAGLTGLTKVEFVGKTSDAEICITGGLAILADQNYDIDVSFEALTLSKPNPTYGGDYGHSTNYFTTWLRNTNAAENTVTYTNCTFPNGLCNNQYGKTVVDGCTFSNTTTKLYNFWNYGGNTEIKDSTFTGTRGIKAYNEGTLAVAPTVKIENTTFGGLTEKAAIVTSKATDITLDNVSATNCTKGFFQKDIELSGETTTIEANGSGISGNFNITAEKGAAAAKEEFNISGGTFTSEVSSDYLADGFEVKDNGDGTYGVAAKNYIAAIGDAYYSTLQEAIDAATRNSTVKLLADTRENVTISTPYVTLDLNGHTLNGSTGERKPALTVTARVKVKDSSEAQTGTIMRDDTPENSGVSSHYVIDIQGSGWLTFESGTVKNGSGAGGTKGASLVRVGSDSVDKYPGLNIKGGTFTQDKFIVIKVERGDLFLNGGSLNSANSYAVQSWHRATIKGGTVNGNVSSWTYSGGLNSTLEISGGTVNGNVESVSYDGSAGKKASVSITGGTVNGTLIAGIYNSATEPTKDMATIEVTGGTFTKDPTKYVIEDSAITKNADGTFGVAKAYLAKVGESYYYTMDEAFKAQTASGEPIVLLRDYTTGSTFNSGTVARVVDLNGHTWTCTGTDANSAAFEINNPNASLTVKNGKIVSSQLVGLIPSAMGGTIKYDNSSLTFENVEMSTTATSGIETNGNNTNDTVKLVNSTLNVPNGFGIYFPSSGKLIIENSKITAKTMGVQVCSGALSISGANTAITVTGDAVEKTENDGAIQDGAAISIVNRTGYKGLDTVTVSGGTFTAKEGNSAIKAYNWANSTESDFTADKGTVAVSGGTFTSAVPEDLCADGFVPTNNADGTYGVKTAGAVEVWTAFSGTKVASYDTIAEAAANLGENKWIVITKDYTLTEDFVIPTGVFLDIEEGATLTVADGVTLTVAADCKRLGVRSGAALINNGTILVLGTNPDGGKVLAFAGGTVDLNKLTVPEGYFLDNKGTSYFASIAVFKITYSDGSTKPASVHTSWKNAAKVTLLTDVSDFTISLNSGDNLAKNFVLDLGGHTLSGKAAASSEVLRINGVPMTITNGTIKYVSSNKGSGALYVSADVTIDSTATIDGGVGYAIWTDGYGHTLTVNGTVKSDGSYAITSNGSENGGRIAECNIIVNNGAKIEAPKGIGIYHPELGTVTVNGGEITAHTGIEMCAGKLVVTGGKITSTGDNWDATGSQNAILDGAAVSIINRNYPGGIPTAEISGGEFVATGTGAQTIKAYDYTNNTVAEWTNVGESVSVSGGTFSSIPDNMEMLCAEGFIPTKNADGTYGVKEGMYVAQIGNVKYETLAEAIAAAKDGDTVKLLADCSGNGIKVEEGKFADKGLIVDFGGHTYTVGGVLVGSAGTGTNAFQLLQGNKITFMNGSIVGATENTKPAEDTPNWHGAPAIMIQNYCDLTLKNMTVTGGDETVYAMSNNHGDVVIENSTINAGKAKGYTSAPIAFDACGYSSYDGVSVTVKGTSVINGDIEISRSSNNAKDVKLTLESGTVNGTLKIDSSIKSGDATTITKSGTFELAAPAGYEWFANGDDTQSLSKAYAKIGETYYKSLADALAAANAGDTVTLTADINTPETSYYIQKSLTIDLGGKTLTGSGYDGVFNIEGENAAVLIKNGKIVAVEQTGTEGKYTMAVWACAAGCEVTLEDLDVSQQITHTDDKQMDMIYTSKGTIIINSGRFESGTPAWTLNCNDSAYKAGTANIIVNGGTFTGYDPRNAENEGKGTSLVADGVGIDKNADGTFTAKSGMAAQIVDADGNSVAAYAGHYDAIAAAKDCETVILLSDRKNFVTNTINANITIDLNGKTLSLGNNNPFFRTNGEVTIQNGTIDTKSTYACVIVNAYNKLTLKNVKITGVTDGNGKSLVNVCSNAEVTIDKDTVLTASGSGVAVFIGQDADAKYTLNVYGKVIQESKSFAICGNGSYKGTTTINIYDGAEVRSASAAIYHPQAGEINVYGGLVEGYCAIAMKSGTLNISGGTVRGTANDHVLDDSNSTSGGANYDGSAIIVDSRSTGYAGNVNINVTGGTVESYYSTAIREIGEQGKTDMTQLTKLNVIGGSVLGASKNPVNVTSDMLVRDISVINISVSGGTFKHAIPDSYCADRYIPTQNADGTYGVQKAKKGSEKNPYTLKELSEMTRAQYIAAQEALGGTMYVEVGNYSYDKNGVLGNGVRNDTPGQTPDHSKLNAYGENGYLGEKNDGANGKNIIFVGGSIKSNVTGYTSIDSIGTSLLLAVPAYTNVTFEGVTFNNVMSFNYQLYTSPWSQLGELKFSGCTFNGIIVGAIAAQTLTFNKCTFTNYTNEVSKNNSNPTWIRPAYGNWNHGDNEGQGSDFRSLTTINFTGNKVTSTRPVKFEYISQWDITSTVTATDNYFDITAQSGDTSIKNVGLYLGAHTDANKFHLVAANNTKSENTAALYTIPEHKTSLPVDSTVKNPAGESIELTDALKWKATDAEKDKIVLKTVIAVASIGETRFATLEEAYAAAKNGDTITLLEDCNSDRINLEDKSVTVALNGKTLTSTAANGVMFCAKNGNKITINGTVEGSKLVGTLMITSGTDGHIEVNGGTYENSQYCPIYVNGAVNSENSTVTVKNAIINATNSNSNQDMGCAVYLAGYSTSVFENCTITAPVTGIEIRAGKLTLNNCDVTGGNGEVTADANGNGTTVTNAALAISQHTTKKPIEVIINGGTFNGTAAVYQTDVQGTGSADVKIAVNDGTFNGEILGETDGAIVISGGKFKVKVDDKYFDKDHACSTDKTGDYYTVTGHPIISAGISISEDMSFRIIVGKGYENGKLKYYYDTIGEDNTIVRVEGEGILGTDTKGNSIFRIYNVNPQRADLIYVIQYYDADGNAVGAPKEISVLTYFEGFYNMEAGKNEDVDARKTFIANFLEYCASAMERSYALHKDVTLNGKTWQDRADAVRAMMTRLDLETTDHEFKGNLGRYFKDNSEGIILKRGVVFGSTFKAYYQISKEAIDNGYKVFRQGMDITDKLELVDGAYRLYFEIAPYEFKDNLTITVYNGTTKVCEYTSPLANTLEVLSKSTDASLAKMAKAAFNYFVALQNYNG